SPLFLFQTHQQGTRVGRQMGRTKRKGGASHSSHRVHSAFVCPERPSLITEPASAPNLVRCYHESRLRVNENVMLELRRLWESACRNYPTLARATDCEFQNSPY